MMRLYILAGSIVVGILCAGGIYWYGKSVGKNEAQIAQLKASVDAQVKREGIENEVSGLDRYAICIDLGGLPGDCEQLRRMEEAAKTK